jgi:carbonic anhydrase
MDSLEHLLEQNKIWAREVKNAEPDFFDRLAGIQAPEYFWISCSDSRIIPAMSLGLLPGEMFVHRNVANLVIYTDMNCLSVMQFAVDVLKVRHIIVCGHYGCGGVKAALDDTRLGLIDNWLRHIQDIAHTHAAELDKLEDYESRLDRLCEINVIEQVVNVGETTIVQDAWLRGQELHVHGWIYYITDGIYRDLKVTVDSLDNLEALRVRMIERRRPTGVGK